MKVALTGGATGIGAQVAKKMFDLGHDVTSFDISDPGANVACWIKTDLSDPLSISEALSAADGPFDALINNAGLPPKDGLANTILSVNFVGFRRFLNGMLDKLSDGAAIVNVASRAGMGWMDNLDEVKTLLTLPEPELAEFIETRSIDHVRAYNLSKEAVIALTIMETENLVARGLRMNAVSPGAVSTGILEDFMTAFGARAQKAVARAGRAANPEEVADVILFLASPDSRWIKGQNIVIDGGMGAMGMTDALGLIDGT